MKKFLSFLTVFCMVSVQMCFTVSAEASKTYDLYNDVMEWFDSQVGKTGEAMLENNGNYIVMRPGGDSISYDVSSLEGRYELSVSYFNTSSDSILNVYAGTLSSYTKYCCTTLGAASSETTVSLGNVYIGADDTRIKLETGSYGAAPILTSMVLTYVSTEPVQPTYTVQAPNFTYSLKANEAGTNNEIQRVAGTDFYSKQGTTEYATYTSNVLTGTDSAYSIVTGAGDTIFRGWFRYDISGMVPGTYKLSLYCASPVNISLTATVDSKTQNGLSTILSRTGYTDYALASPGNIYIPSGASYLKLAANQSMYCKYFKLEYVSSENLKLADNLTFQAETITDPTVTGSGTWFYDTGGANKWDTSTSGTRTVVLMRPNEWAKYAVVDLKPGAYMLSSYSCNGGVGKANVEFDGTVIKTGATLTASSGYYTTYENSNLCRVYIDNSDTHYIKITNSGSSAQYFDYFTLTPYNSYVTEKTINYNEHYAYYDSSATGNEGFQVNGNSVVIKNLDSVTYNVSDLEEGIYKVTIYGTNSADSALNVYFGTTPEIQGAGIINLVNDMGNGYYTVTANRFLGYVNIKDNLQLKLITVEGANNNATMVSSITLKKENAMVSERFASAGTGNAGANEVISVADLLGSNTMGTVYGRVELANNTDSALVYDIYAASYVDRAMTSCNLVKSVTCAARNTNEVAIDVSVSSDATVKLFIFKNGAIQPAFNNALLN